MAYRLGDPSLLATPCCRTLATACCLTHFPLTFSEAQHPQDSHAQVHDDFNPLPLLVQAFPNLPGSDDRPLARIRLLCEAEKKSATSRGHRSLDVTTSASSTRSATSTNIRLHRP
eukprot:8554330-Heterocapsa_arctica.AAC.1